jgi:hypothetical protein
MISIKNYPILKRPGQKMGQIIDSVVTRPFGQTAEELFSDILIVGRSVFLLTVRLFCISVRSKFSFQGYGACKGFLCFLGHLKKSRALGIFFCDPHQNLIDLF